MKIEGYVHAVVSINHGVNIILINMESMEGELDVDLVIVLSIRVDESFINHMLNLNQVFKITSIR